MKRIISCILLSMFALAGCKKDRPADPEPEPLKAALAFSPGEALVGDYLYIIIKNDTLDRAKPANLTVNQQVLTNNVHYRVTTKDSLELFAVPNVPAGSVEVVVENDGKKIVSQELKVISRAIWELKGNLPVNRYGAVAVSIGTKAYVGTGTDFTTTASDYNLGNYNLYSGLVLAQGYNGGFKNDWWEYDPASNAWTALPDLPGSKRYAAAGFTLNGKAYVGLGHLWESGLVPPVFYKDFYEYDPVSKNWTKLPDFPGAARSGAVCFTIQNKAYVALGFKEDGPLKDVWEFDGVTKQWHQLADAPVNNTGGGNVAVTISNKGYVHLGSSGELWEVVPATGWVKKSTMPGQYRRGATAFVIGNKGYFGTGHFYQQAPYPTYYNWSDKDFYEYDPVANSWLKMDYMDNREAAFGFSIGDRGYVGGGLYLRQNRSHGVDARLLKTMFSFTRR